MKSPSLLFSLLTGRCPRCRKGPLFESAEWNKPSSWFAMHKSCTCCQQSFEPEPGFYFGAMFVSYAFNTALFIAVWIAYSFLASEFSLFYLLMMMILAAALALPFFFRLSRSLWIHLFVPYGSKSEKR